MTEKDLTEELQEPSGGLSSGAMLREAREAAKLSVEEVASELHLVSDIVLALENGDRSKLPSRVFTLGYLKNYAKLVNIPYEQVKTAFDDFTDEQLPVLNQPRAPQIPEQARGGGWFIKAIGWMILIAFLLLAYLWWKGEVAIPGVDLDFPLGDQQMPSGQMPVIGESPSARVTLDQETNQQILLPPVETAETTDAPAAASDFRQQEQQVVVTSDPAAETAETSDEVVVSPMASAPERDATEPVSSDDAMTQPDSDTPAEAISIPLETAIEKPSGLEQLDRIADVNENIPEPDSAVTANNPDADAAESSQQSIRISFSGPCWVQITDSRGELVLNGEMRAGDARNIQGDAPFRFVLGNAGAVELVVGDKRFDLEPYTSGNVARFTLEAREG
jgi:cytoskeleton protein RodZ